MGAGTSMQSAPLIFALHKKVMRASAMHARDGMLFKQPESDLTYLIEYKAIARAS